MSKLTREDVLNLARLSKLRLSEDEVTKMQSEMSEILGYVEILNKTDTAGVKPTYQVTGLKNVTRADETKDHGYEISELLKNAPATQDGQFKVRRVL